MLANITFKAYQSLPKNTKKTDENLLTSFTLNFADTDKIDKIIQAIESSYEYDCISWDILIDHEYI
jgi:hypothetical protein